MEYRGCRVWGQITNGAKYIGIEITRQRDGQTDKMLVRKHTPRGCSAPRRICIVCQSVRIDKRSKRYGSRICLDCAEPMPAPILVAGPCPRTAVAGPGPHPGNPAFPAVSLSGDAS